MSALIIHDMPEAEYHAHPALSATGAKTIALRSPAHYQWERENRVEKKVFDVGHAVHARVLGVGMQVVEIPDDLLSGENRTASSKAAKDFIEAARTAGQVPLKAADLEHIDAMAEAVLTHPVARRLLAQAGTPEASLFATDPATGVALRARVDYLPDHDPARRTILTDLKTTENADPRRFGNTAADYGYFIQEDFYQRVLGLARGDDDAAFVFIAVEKKPPYLVSVTELTDTFRAIGHRLTRDAIATYAACAATNTWPGYGDTIHAVPPPAWLTYQYGDAS